MTGPAAASMQRCQHARCDRKQPIMPRVRSTRARSVTFARSSAGDKELPSTASARSYSTPATSSCALTSRKRSVCRGRLIKSALGGAAVAAASSNAATKSRIEPQKKLEASTRREAPRSCVGGRTVGRWAWTRDAPSAQHDQTECAVRAAGQACMHVLRSGRTISAQWIKWRSGPRPQPSAHACMVHLNGAKIAWTGPAHLDRCPRIAAGSRTLFIAAAR